MADPFIGEIRAVGFTFPPRGWAVCDGQVLLIGQNTALFSLLGNQYGGDGVATFALPDLRDRSPIHQGQGPGLTNRTVGESGGQAAVTLTEGDLPAHTHQVLANDGTGGEEAPPDRVWAATTCPAYAPDPDTHMSPAGTSQTGGDQPHNNRQPYLGLTFIIALQGIFPPRS